MANNENKKRNMTKRLTYTAILTALYVVLSALLRIQVIGHIAVDLGYIVLMVGAVCLGPIPAMMIGALGAGLESMIMAQRGLSIGWVLMNAIIGYICGRILSRATNKDQKHFIFLAILVVLGSVLLGITVKTLVDCAIYNLPFIAKIPTSLTAWLLDSFVMLAIGLPLSLNLKKKFKSIL